MSRLRDQYRSELSFVTKLSPAGVDFALDHALETDPSQAELDALIDGATEASRVVVVLSSNVFTASLRAIALAKAAAAKVIVKPSRREPMFVRLLAEYASDPDVEIVKEIDIRSIEHGELHAYGSDATLQTIAAQVPNGAVLRAHGTGFGVACIDATAPLDEAAEALSRDVVLFDQSGCLSPRIAFVVGDSERAEAFGRSVYEALNGWATRVPRGAVDEQTLMEVRGYADSMRMVGAVLEAKDHVVAIWDRVRLPPAARVVHIVPLRGPELLDAALGKLAPFVTTVGAYGAPLEMRWLSRGRRAAVLGMMQSPPLDGPVDPRVWPPSTVT